MDWKQVLLFVLAVPISAALTSLVRRVALSRGVLDVPNARSSHTRPTPRGGGMSIVIVVSLATSLLLALYPEDSALCWAMLGGGLPVAVVGYLDDRSSLSVRVRIAVHVACAAWAVYILGGLPTIAWGGRVINLGIWGDLLAGLAVVWMLNLFNFMDGIDGIAASEAVFVAGSGGWLCWVAGVQSAACSVSLVVAAASFGFLLWNWPPARIFLGDIGSGYLGFVLAVLALDASRRNGLMVWIWLILSAAFFTDATVTLLRRALSGQRVFEAHRSHAYQRFSRKFGRHRPVTLGFVAVNMAWLLPCAALTLQYPGYAIWITLLAFTPLAVVAVVTGAGRREPDN